MRRRWSAERPEEAAASDIGARTFRHLPSLNRHLALRLALGLALASALPQSVSGQVGLTRGDHVRVRFGNEHAYSFGDREETSISGVRRRMPGLEHNTCASPLIVRSQRHG